MFSKIKKTGLLILPLLISSFTVSSLQAEEIESTWRGVDKLGNVWEVVEQEDELTMKRVINDGLRISVKADYFYCSVIREDDEITTTMDVEVGGAFYLFVNKETMKGEQYGVLSVAADKKSFYSQLKEVSGDLCIYNENREVTSHD